MDTWQEMFLTRFDAYIIKAIFSADGAVESDWRHESGLAACFNLSELRCGDYVANLMRAAGVRETRVISQFWQRDDGAIDTLRTSAGDRSYDIVFAMNVLEQSADVWAMADSLRSLVSEGGRLVVILRQPVMDVRVTTLLPIWASEDEWRFNRETAEQLFAGFQTEMVAEDAQHSELALVLVRQSEHASVRCDGVPVYSWRARRCVKRQERTQLGYFHNLIELMDIGLDTMTDKALFLHNYLAKYEFFLKKFRHRHITLLELGVFTGASERMWERYFPYAEIYGVDIDERCKQYATERIHILIKDLSRIDTLQELCTLHPQVIIDDASHVWSHQIVALFTLFESLSSGGVYILEDMETSLDLPHYEAGGYDDCDIDAYTVCERIMRVAAAKIPEHRDGYSENINAIGMNVELAAVMKGSCILIKR